jgi:ubiquinone/menaquinone biosynthesis C-methylase UbiE
VSEAAITYDDSAAYELFMGKWSRAVAPVFLDWLRPPSSARWLEVGCGTGIFTEYILDRCAPHSVVAIDSSQAQIRHALGSRMAARADFRVADAQALSFDDASFDIVVSALLINFVPEPTRAISEMRRVLCTGGLVGGYVWDFAEERSPSWPMRQGMRRFGIAVPDVPGTITTGLASLNQLFEQATFRDIDTRSIEVTQSFESFDAFWRAQTPGYMPTTQIINALPDSECRRLMDTVRAGLPATPNGRIEYAARAHAIKARA